MDVDVIVIAVLLMPAVAAVSSLEYFWLHSSLRHIDKIHHILGIFSIFFQNFWILIFSLPIFAEGKKISKE